MHILALSFGLAPIFTHPRRSPMKHNHPLNNSLENVTLAQLLAAPRVRIAGDISLQEVKDMGACSGGWREAMNQLRAKNVNTDLTSRYSALQIIAGLDGYDYPNWLLSRLTQKQSVTYTYRLAAVTSIELVVREHVARGAWNGTRQHTDELFATLLQIRQALLSGDEARINAAMIVGVDVGARIYGAYSGFPERVGSFLRRVCRDEASMYDYNVRIEGDPARYIRDLAPLFGLRSVQEVTEGANVLVFGTAEYDVTFDADGHPVLTIRDQPAPVAGEVWRHAETQQDYLITNHGAVVLAGDTITDGVLLAVTDGKAPSSTHQPGALWSRAYLSLAAYYADRAGGAAA